MDLHDRIRDEMHYLTRRTKESRLQIRLCVRSAGASFQIVNPSTGEEHESAPVPTQSASDFKRALDRAIADALL